MSEFKVHISIEYIILDVFLTKIFRYQPERSVTPEKVETAFMEIFWKHLELIRNVLEVFGNL